MVAAVMSGLWITGLGILILTGHTSMNTADRTASPDRVQYECQLEGQLFQATVKDRAENIQQVGFSVL
jgi:hypothetical protein